MSSTPFRTRRPRPTDEVIRLYGLSSAELSLAEELASRRGCWTLLEIQAQVGPDRASGVYQVALSIREHRDGGDPGLAPAPTSGEKKSRHTGRRPR